MRSVTVPVESAGAEVVMKPIGACVALLLLLVLPGSVRGEEGRHGVGIAFVAGSADLESGTDWDFKGVGVFGKAGFTDHWGLIVSFFGMEDDEDFAAGSRVEYTQWVAEAVYGWRPAKKFRPHLKAGWSSTDLELSELGSSVSDDEFGMTFGAGLDAGSEHMALYVDLEYTDVELFDVDFEIIHSRIGVLFKF